MIKQNKYIFLGILTAVVYWLGDSAIDYHLSVVNDFEFIPVDFTERWMRLVIFSQFIVLGFVVNRHVGKLQEANGRLLQEIEQRHKSDLEAQLASANLLRAHEKAEIYLSTVQATQHILNNLLNQLQYFKIQAEKTTGFDKETLKLYDGVTAEALDLVNKLSNVKHVNKSEIHNSVRSK